MGKKMTRAKPQSAKGNQLAVGGNLDYALQDSKPQEINLSAWIF